MLFFYLKWLDSDVPGFSPGFLQGCLSGFLRVLAASFRQFFAYN